MKASILQTASYTGLSTASKPTGALHSGTTSQILPVTAAVEKDAEFDRTGDASIGINTCGWYEGRAVTCAAPATCGYSSTFRACCVDQACSSSVFNTACLPYDDDACLAGTPGPATKCWSVCSLSPTLSLHAMADVCDARSSDTSSPACQTLFWPTSPGAPDLTVFTMVDWCAPISEAGHGIVASTPPPQAPTPSPPQDSGSSPLLKPPAGTILEVFLGATLIFVLVIISCVIIARKMHTSRTGEVGTDDSCSSLTVSAFPGQLGQEPDIPLSTQPEMSRGAGENKMDQPRRGDVQHGSEAARV
ncbi:hypothetical protein F5883DRAFT_128777 [Diaporthe sp. PMI_573]|nr:hypothetical protein F5883DRAFT_128777 [Diaporthaceae sp. PMI_573]